MLMMRKIGGYRNRPKRQESLWKKRKTTIKYLLLMLCGLLLGSIAAVMCGVDGLPCRIILNRLAAIPSESLWTLWWEKALFMAILLLYLLIAGRCLWGNGMISAAPLLFGMAQGAAVTFLLMLLGWGGMGYLLAAYILPKTVQLAGLILLCNTAHSSCEQLCGGGEKATAMLWLSGTAILAAGGLLQALIQIKLTAGILQ